MNKPRNSINITRLLTVCFCTIAGALPLTSNATVIYRNNFGNNTGVTIALNNANIGWNVARSQNGGNVTDESSTADARVGVFSITGKPTNVSNINAPVSLSDTTGVVELINGSGATVIYQALFYTTQYTINTSAYTVNSMQWYGNNASAGGTQRLAVEVGGSWYVSQTLSPSTGSGGAFATGAALLTVGFDTATWYSLAFTVGSTPFTIGGSSVALPNGNISAYGVFVDPTTATGAASRFDTFTINATAAVPEPAAVALLGIAGAMLMGCFRRRQK